MRKPHSHRPPPDVPPNQASCGLKNRRSSVKSRPLAPASPRREAPAERFLDSPQAPNKLAGTLAPPQGGAKEAEPPADDRPPPLGAFVAEADRPPCSKSRSPRRIHHPPPLPAERLAGRRNSGGRTVLVPPPVTASTVVRTPAIDPSAAVEVPDRVRPHLAPLLDRLPGWYLDQTAKAWPGGFTRRPAILQRLRQNLGDLHQVPGHLLLALSDCLAIPRFLPLLAPEGAKLAVDFMVLQWGPAETAVALWLDPREEIQQLHPLIEAATLALPPPEGAPAPWSEWIVSQFLDPVDITQPRAKSQPSPSAQGTAPDPETAAKAEAKLRETRERLRETERTAARERRELTESHRAELAAVASERDAARSELAALRTQVQQRHAEDLQAAIGERTRPWLARAIALEEAATDSRPEFERLQEDFGLVAAQQLHADRHSGNLVRIREELAELERLREQGQVASEATLHPVPEWRRLLERLDHAIVRRRELLKQPPAAAPWILDLGVQLATADSPDAVGDILRRVQLLAQGRLLPAEAVRWLEQRARQRGSALAPERGAGPGPVVVTISDVLRGRAAGILLVDVYNWIGRAGLILGVSDQPEDFTASFRQLTPMLREAVRRAPGMELNLFLDGPEGRSGNLGPGIRLHWSGGTGKDRADHLLTGHLQHLNRVNDPRPVFVVSDDRAVAAESRARGAVVEDASPFARRLMARVGDPRGR